MSNHCGPHSTWRGNTQCEDDCIVHILWLILRRGKYVVSGHKHYWAYFKCTSDMHTTAYLVIEILVLWSENLTFKPQNLLSLETCHLLAFISHKIAAGGAEMHRQPHLSHHKACCEKTICLHLIKIRSAPRHICFERCEAVSNAPKWRGSRRHRIGIRMRIRPLPIHAEGKVLFFNPHKHNDLGVWT